MHQVSHFPLTLLHAEELVLELAQVLFFPVVLLLKNDYLAVFTLLRMAFLAIALFLLQSEVLSTSSPWFLAQMQTGILMETATPTAERFSTGDSLKLLLRLYYERRDKFRSPLVRQRSTTLLRLQLSTSSKMTLRLLPKFNRNTGLKQYSRS